MAFTADNLFKQNFSPNFVSFFFVTKSFKQLQSNQSIYLEQTKEKKNPFFSLNQTQEFSFASFTNRKIQRSQCRFAYKLIF